jgi:mycofactocin system creatininase family protein
VSARLLGPRAWPELERRAIELLAVPLGATEQHGPHLPLDTDTRVASALAERLAERRPGVLVAPALSYGASGEHEMFPGTLSIGRGALEVLVLELVRSASRWVERTVLISGHGGNAAALRRAERRLHTEGRSVLTWIPAIEDGDAHAGRVETSLLLALAPEQVRTGCLAPGNPAPLSELIDAIRERTVRGVSPTGVLGDPSGASAVEGHALLQRMSDELCEAVARWLR